MIASPLPECRLSQREFDRLSFRKLDELSNDERTRLADLRKLDARAVERMDDLKRRFDGEMIRLVKYDSEKLATRIRLAIRKTARSRGISLVLWQSTVEAAQTTDQLKVVDLTDASIAELNRHR